MTQSIDQYIDGKRVAGTGRTVDVYDPSIGAPAKQLPFSTVDEINAAIASAKVAQREWASWNPQRRARVMMRFIDLVNQNMDELASLLSAEHGKTLADARGDVQRGLEVI